MIKQLRFALVLLVGMALSPSEAGAQEPTTITGIVYVGGGVGTPTPETGRPLAGATVMIPSLNLGTITNEQGRYVLIVPAARAQGQTVQVQARQIGYQTVSDAVELVPGRVTQNFVLTEDPLRLEEIVVTGQGTRTTREKLGVTVTSVNADEVVNSQEPNIVGALAGKAPGVNVTTASGEPGAGSYIQIRGQNTIYGGTQPLIVVDGIPVNNETYQIESIGNPVDGTVQANRALDLNPNDIESIEILKGPAAGAIYGSRAASGVILITTKSGQPGANRVSFKSSASFMAVNQMQDLQHKYTQGLWLITRGQPDREAAQIASWGLPLDCAQFDPGTGQVTDFSGCQEGVDWFDHADELFDTGMEFDNNLTLSGGTETTTYYLSLGRYDSDGVIDGNSSYAKNQARLKGSHSFTPEVTVSGNFFYADSEGDLVQQGSNISGLLLGALRTPPEFDNCLPASAFVDAGRDPETPCYLDPVTGLHRSYRLPNPTSLTEGRGFDNPFWVARAIPNTTDVARTIANIEVNYEPFTWLNVNYLLGADITGDERLTVFPKSSTNFPAGKMIRANFTEKIFDSNLVLTANREINDFVSGSLALGANWNQNTFKRILVEGTTLILGTDQLDFTVDRIPNEFRSEVNTAGYFTQANVDLWDQLFLTGAVRLDGSSTFGAAADQWHLYPKVTAAWNFTDLPGWQSTELLNFGKLRFAWGVTGKQPPVYTNITGFSADEYDDSWLEIGLKPIYGGIDGVYVESVQGNPAIEPERTTGWDAGIDLAFFNGAVNFGATYYDEETEDVILDVEVPYSTGFQARWLNGARISNQGVELTLGLRPVERDDFSWNIDAQWATNDSCVEDLANTEFIFLAGFTEPGVGLLRPERDAEGNVTRCFPYNTFYGFDFIRFGRGIELDLDGDGVQESIDAAFPNAPEGALFIGEDGFPGFDPQKRVLGSANPDWTAGIRTTFTFWKRLSLSALVDFNQGSRMWNGTKGALYYYGTHADTEPYHGLGKTEVFGQTYLEDEEVAGPGAGEEVLLNWETWFRGGLGSGFTGPSEPFIEDASFIKLRDVSIGLNIDDRWFRPMSSLGFSSADIMLVGRNLVTWTDYTGIDPESNLTSQTAGRGLEYFNNPRVRAYSITVTLNR